MQSNSKSPLKALTIIPNELIMDTSISPQTRCLYCLLASKPDGPKPSNSALAKELGCCCNSVGRHLKKLAKAGWITISGEGTAKIYTLYYQKQEIQK